MPSLLKLRKIALTYLSLLAYTVRISRDNALKWCDCKWLQVVSMDTWVHNEQCRPNPLNTTSSRKSHRTNHCKEQDLDTWKHIQKRWFCNKCTVVQHGKHNLLGLRRIYWTSQKISLFIQINFVLENGQSTWLSMRAGSKLLISFTQSRRGECVWFLFPVYLLYVQFGAVWIVASLCGFCFLEVWSVYLFLSWSLLISLVWIINCFSSLLVEREFSSSWISSLDVWFRTCNGKKYMDTQNT